LHHKKIPAVFAFDGVDCYGLPWRRLPVANLSQNLRQINIQKVISDPQFKTISYCDQFSRRYAQAEVKLGRSEMSLGELDNDDPDLGPTNRFGAEPTLGGYHGEPGLGAVEVVRTWLDELPDVLGLDKLIEPCQVEVGLRDAKDPGGSTGLVLVAQSHSSRPTCPRRGFVSADAFTWQDHLAHERIRASLIATCELGDVESDLVSRGTRYPLVDLDDPRLTRSGSRMMRAARQPAKSPACCIREADASARRSQPGSAQPYPAVISFRSWQESGTATARDWLTPAAAHVRP
jgi:S-adenosylmethionine decarboxylase